MAEARELGDVLEVVAIIALFVVILVGFSAVVYYRATRGGSRHFPGDGDM